MSRQEEMEILKMVEEGKVNAEEAMKLLDAVRASSGETEAEAAQTSGRARWLRVRCIERGDEKVNIRVPIFLAKSFGGWATRFIPQKARQKMKEQGIELQTIRETLSHLGQVGKTHLVDVRDEEQGEHVEVWLE